MSISKQGIRAVFLAAGFCLLLLPAQLLFAQDTLRLQGLAFATRQFKQPNAVGGPPIRMQRIQSIAGQSKALDFIMLEQYEDGHSTQWRKGCKQMVADTLALYTVWGFKGDDLAAGKGAMLEMYVADGSSRTGLRKVKAEIYLEIGLLGDGRAFLHQKAETPEDLALFRAYVQGIQREYGARFVYGQAADNLVKAAKLAVRAASLN